MPQFTIRAHVEPDMEGPGLPGEPDKDDKAMKAAVVMKKPGQFTLPKSPGGKKPPPSKKKGPPDAKDNR